MENQRPPNPSVFNAVKPSRAIAVDVTAVGADQEKTYQKHVLHEAARPAPLELELIQHHSVCRSKCTAARCSRNEAAEFTRLEFAMSVALQLARSPAASPNGAGGNYPVRGCSAISGDFLHCWVACLDITRRGQPARGISCTTRANAHEEVSAWGVDAAWGHPASRLTYS